MAPPCQPRPGKRPRSTREMIPVFPGVAPRGIPAMNNEMSGTRGQPMSLDRPWPFVGRERELARVAAALGRPDAAGLLLAGPAGVGKTRLATECATIAERVGFRCARVLATRAAANVPLGALA